MSGYDVFCGWGDETAWSTPVARTQFARPYAESRADHIVPQDPVAYLGLRDNTEPFTRVEKGEMELHIPAVYDGMGKLLKHCFGAAPADAGVDPYTHIYTLTDSPFDPIGALFGLTVELHQALPDAVLQSMVLYGGRVQSFGMDMRVDEEIKLDVMLVGAQVAQLIKTASPTYPDYSAHTIKPIQVTFALDGGADIDINRVSWEVQNNLRDDKAKLGSKYIKAPLPKGKRVVSGVIEKEWLAKADYDKFLAGTAAAIAVTCTGPASHSFLVELDNVRYTGKTPGLVEGDEILNELPFTAYYDATKGALRITEENTTAVGG